MRNSPSHSKNRFLSEKKDLQSYANIHSNLLAKYTELLESEIKNESRFKHQKLLNGLVDGCVTAGEAIFKGLASGDVSKDMYKTGVEKDEVISSSDMLTIADMISQTLGLSHLTNTLEQMGYGSEDVYIGAEELHDTFDKFLSDGMYSKYLGSSEKLLYSLDEWTKYSNKEKFVILHDPIDGTSLFRKWVKTLDDDDARWVMALSLAKINPKNKNIEPHLTTIFNPVTLELFVFEADTDTSIVYKMDKEESLLVMI